MRSNPHLFEANAFWFLRRVSDAQGKPLTLGQIPEKEWKSLRERGIDIVWLMGVWKRSPGARQKALEVFKGESPENITGSPYAVLDYSLDLFLGGEGDLRELKERLNRLGLKLMLDFVPNHLALDHPWALGHPEYFISKSPGHELGNQFFETKPGVFLAHGRDPYFPPWTDTVQINYFSPAAREAMMGELARIAESADGVRCDMAMLPINDIFQNVWGPLAGHPKPEKEFWPEAIGRIRRKHPDFIFMAEAYWNTEWQLQQMGFDFTYDKTLYDRLRHSSAHDVRGHLLAEPDYQRHSVRFIENHDEKRAVEAFGTERSLAAATVAFTLPGLRFFHEGQWEGRRIHTSIQRARIIEEKESEPVKNFYVRLLKIIDAPAFHEGKWKLLAASSNLLAWSWELGPDMHLIVVNDSSARCQGRVKLPRKIRGAKKISFADRLREVRYSYSADEINEQGICVDLGPWEAHLLEGPIHEKEEK